ncbi:MAG TPA: exodeoxyribonuclease VII small subunit [Anaeromyxobacteraceae bacterium]|nr:exodeoxyribonuclease VII small subunit [Anaeromyxobacteraceae bacterium]
MSRENQGKNPPSVEAAEPYDALVARLEKVVGELESGTLSLEQSIERFAEGIRIAREASRKLDEAERRVELLVKNEAGEDQAVPFDPEGEKGTP